VTFSRNSAPDNGAAINGPGGAVMIQDSILWDTGSDETFHDAFGTLSVSDSLIRGGCPSGATCDGRIIDENPLLGALAYNGGPTKTRDLRHGSLAIDAGNDLTCEVDDQRHHARPFDGNGNSIEACDMGAFERGAPTTTVITRDKPDSSISRAAVTVRVSVNSGFEVPTGHVAVSSADSHCTITLKSGVGSCVLHPITTGVQTIRAKYAGAEFLEPSADTEPHRVTAKTAVRLTLSPNPVA